MNYKVLLIAHVICADQQIHNKETKALEALVRNSSVSAETQDQLEKILNQDENCLSLENIAENIKREDQKDLLREMLVFAHVDGYFSLHEKDIVEKVAKIWGLTDKDIIETILQAENFYKNYREENVKEDDFLSDFLFSKIDYDKSIEKCSKIAQEDYKFAELCLAKTDTTLENLQESISRKINEFQKHLSEEGKADSANEAIEYIETIKKVLEHEIIEQIQQIHKSLESKKRSLGHFSLAIMGKTKTGKSTLKSIITGEDWNAIGKGKQRTTRLIRIHEYKSIRIIDTPGIGAPKGISDEKIAKSIINESDLVCLVVTDDSIQETEFQFLSLLKDSTKPIIILLNIKRGLRENIRLNMFLENPDKFFSKDSNNDLKGHIDRIHEYAKKHYANNHFKIVPVILLAAQMAKENAYIEKKDILTEASKIHHFVGAVEESVINHGVIYRSQRLLGSTAGDIEKPLKLIKSEVESSETLINKLKQKRELA